MAIVTLVVLLIIGAVSAQQQPNGADVVTDTPTPPPVDLPETGFLDKETLYELLKIFEKDGFVNVTTVPVRGGEQEDEAQRKKRSAGFYGGGGGGCGSHPVVGVRFSSCFTPGRVVYQNNHIVHNYYRTGGYGNCMNYFNALPLASVHPVSGGYSGQLFGGYGRTYTVSSCRSCYGGYSGIGIRCNNAPYSYLSRQFVFRPSVNRVNVNNYNYGGGYGGGFGGGFGGYGGGFGVGFGGYGGGYGGSYGGSYGGYAGGVAVAAAPVAVAAAPVAVASAPVAVAAAPVAVGGGGGCYGGGCGGGYAGGCHGSHC